MIAIVEGGLMKRRIHHDKIKGRCFLLKGNRVMNVSIDDQIMLAGGDELGHE